MNNQLYQQLAPLGFAEWLYKSEIYANARCKILDELDIDDINRTQFNSLAFRWLREEKKIFAYVTPYKDHAADNNDPVEYKSIVVTYIKYHEKIHPTHSLAEHEALCKALEILSKGGENG